MSEEDWAAAADEQERRLTGQVDKLVISNSGPRTVLEEKPKSDDSGWEENSPVINSKDTDTGSDQLAESSLITKLLRNKLVTTKHEVEVMRSDPNSPLYSVKSFEELPLSADLKKGVYEMGFNKPSKIQETALPLLLADPPNNMIAQSQSGTGKTAAFVLTMLSRVDATKDYPQVLCLSPTFELAMQTGKVAEQMGKHCPHIRITYAVRGHQLMRGQRCTDHIIIGTPGTLLDWIRKLRAFDPKKINVFVLDEADIMIAMQGHQDQSIRVQKTLPKQCQTLLFSATYDDEVMAFAKSVVSNPIEIRLRREEESLDNIKQYYVMCKNANDKFEAICNLYGVLSIGQCIVFCMTRRSASWLAEKMVKCGHPVAMLSGEITIEQRLAVINRFREGKEKLLITTNVSARGIDIEQVTLVVNYDMPIDPQGRPDFETYLHRIGRTGRFGKSGVAVNFIDGERSLNVMKKIEEHFGRKIHHLDADDVDELEKIN